MDQDGWELSAARGRRWGGQDHVLGEGLGAGRGDEDRGVGGSDGGQMVAPLSRVMEEGLGHPGFWEDVEVTSALLENQAATWEPGLERKAMTAGLWAGLGLGWGCPDIHSTNKCLMSTYCVPSPVLDAGTQL